MNSETHPQLPVIPSLWSNPQNVFQYIKAAQSDFLNVIPPSSLEKPYTTFPSFAGDTHYISDPEINRVILRDQVDDFPKSRSITVLLEPLIRQSIFITHGEKWRAQHKIAIKTFNLRRILDFAPMIAETSEAALQNFDFDRLDNGDITPFFQELTFEVITKLLLGEAGAEEFEALRTAFEDNLDYLGKFNLLDLAAIRFPSFPNTRKLRYRSTVEGLHKVGNAIFARRLRARQPKDSDFLEILLSAYEYDEAPSEAKANEIIDNLVSFLIAGHETTAMTLAWGAYVAGFFPESQEKLAREADHPLEDMPYTESFINEVLRLYPAAPVLLRSAEKTLEMKGLRINKGEGIIIPAIAIQRHRDYWDDPDRFLPERFMDFKPDPYFFMPFGAGPRICIGKTLAMMEAKIIMAKFLKYVTIQPSNQVPEPMMRLTLRPRHGIQLHLSKRKM